MRDCAEPVERPPYCAEHLAKARTDHHWVAAVVDKALDTVRCAWCGATIVVARRYGPDEARGTAAYALEVDPEGRCQLIPDMGFTVLNAHDRDSFIESCLALGRTPVLYRSHGPACPRRPL